jgi:hypothetical protein
MPIKGLTDRESLRFPQIGDIRKGAPKDKQGRVGRDLDYFRVEFTEGEEAAAEAFKTIYDEQPREINVLLPFRNVEQNFEAWQEEYNNTAMLHRCDGETTTLWIDKETGEWRYDPKPCPGGCVPVGRLKVLLPELRRLAFLVVHTTSVNDILELTANLEALARLTGNGVNGIPLVLKRRPRMISVPIKGKRARVKKWLLSLEADQRWVEAQIGAMQAEALPVWEPPAVLPATTETGPDWDSVPEEIITTPEAEFEEVAEAEVVESKNDGNGTDKGPTWPSALVSAVIEAGHAENPPHVMGMLTTSKILSPDTDAKLVLSWAGEYRRLRDEGAQSAFAAKEADKVLTK